MGRCQLVYTQPKMKTSKIVYQGWPASQRPHFLLCYRKEPQLS